MSWSLLLTLTTQYFTVNLDDPVFYCYP